MEAIYFPLYSNPPHTIWRKYLTISGQTENDQLDKVLLQVNVCDPDCNFSVQVYENPTRLDTKSYWENKAVLFDIGKSTTSPVKFGKNSFINRSPEVANLHEYNEYGISSGEYFYFIKTQQSWEMDTDFDKILSTFKFIN